MTDEKYTAQELEEMANALLAQDKSADKAEKRQARRQGGEGRGKSREGRRWQASGGQAGASWTKRPLPPCPPPRCSTPTKS